MFRTVGEARAFAESEWEITRPVVDFPKVRGREDVWRDSLGRFEVAVVSDILPVSTVEVAMTGKTASRAGETMVTGLGLSLGECTCGAVGVIGTTSMVK